MHDHGFLGQVRLVPVQRQPQPQASGSPGRRWWDHHIRNTRALAEAAFAGDNQGALAAVGELWDAVKNWEKLTGSPVAGVLMGEHTVLAKLLVDCLSKNLGQGCADAAVGGLLRNVEAQRALFPRQPGAFAALFGPHTELAGAYITDLSQGNMDDFKAHFAQALANGDQLGAFTDRAFFGIQAG